MSQLCSSRAAIQAAELVWSHVSICASPLLESLEAEDMPHEDRDMTADQQDNTQLTFAAGQDKPVPWNSAAAHESMKARRLNELKKLKKQVSSLTSIFCCICTLN